MHLGYPNRTPHRFAEALRGIVAALLALAISCGIGVANAADLASSASKLGASHRATFQEGIAELGTIGDPKALVILEALDAGLLRVEGSGRVLVAKKDGTLTDPLTGQPATAQGATKTPVVNNVVRRGLNTALAQLRLISPDLEVRLRAAEDLSRHAGDEAVPVMREALQNEKDDSIREVLALGIARKDLTNEDEALRLAAVETLGESGEVGAKADLEQMLTQRTDGTFAEPSEEVREAAKSALVSLKGRVFFINIFANLFYGVSLGSVLLLAALGLAITFGLMGVINMAHGEMIMLGAYATFVVQNAFASYAPDLLDLYLFAAIPVAFAVCMAVGMLLERTVVRFLYGRPLETLLATWGLSLLLIQTVRMIFGAQNVTVANPSWLSGGWELMPTVVLPYSRLAVIGFVIVVVAFVYFLLQKTPLGLHVRAVTQNRAMAASMGIPTRKVDMWTFGLGSAVAGLGGVALSQLGNVGPELGQSYIVDSFMVVVVGGVGNIAGTVAGALGLGIVNKFIEPVSGAVLGKIIILGLLILFIQKRPQGIFALKGRSAEA